MAATKDDENTSLLGRSAPSDNNQYDSTSKRQHRGLMALPPTFPTHASDEEEEETKDFTDEELRNSHIRILDTKLAMYNLSEIDTATRTFRCNVEVTMDWIMSPQQQNDVEKLKDSPDKLIEYLDTVEYPKVFALNAREIDTVYSSDPEVVICADRNDKNQLSFHTVQNLNGVWEMGRDKDELDDFPFDSHTLPIRISTKSAATDRFSISTPKANVSVFPSECQEFDGYMMEIHTRVAPNSTNKTYDGMIDISIRVKRQWRYYFNQVAIFVLFLSVMLIPGFSMGARDVSDRMSYFVTLLLAQTALLYFVSGSLPKLQYFSVLDEYILGNFMLTLACAIQTSVMVLIEDDDLAVEVDEYCMYAFIALLALLNIYYIFDSWKRSRNIKSEQYLMSKSINTKDEYFVKPDKEYLVRFRRWRRKRRQKRLKKMRMKQKNKGDGTEDGKKDGEEDERRERKRKNREKRREENKDKDKGDEDEEEYAHLRGGPCVYYAPTHNKVGKYRDWRKEKQEEFDKNYSAKLDEIVVLFGHNGSYEAREFFEQNGFKFRKFRQRNKKNDDKGKEDQQEN